MLTTEARNLLRKVLLEESAMKELTYAQVMDIIAAAAAKYDMTFNEAMDSMFMAIKECYHEHE